MIIILCELFTDHSLFISEIALKMLRRKLKLEESEHSF